MDSPPLIAYIVFGVGLVALGPVSLVAGIRAYTGRYTSWLALRVATGSTARHSRLGFVCFWGGLMFTGALAAISLGLMGMPETLVRVIAVVSWSIGLPIAMMHQYFLPKFLRPVLLPRWYREWEDAQFEREEREDQRRRARRQRRREKRRKEKDAARKVQAKAAAKQARQDKTTSIPR